MKTKMNFLFAMMVVILVRLPSFPHQPYEVLSFRQSLSPLFVLGLREVPPMFFSGCLPNLPVNIWDSRWW